LDTSDTKTAHKRSAYLEEEEEDKKEEDKTGVSIFALFLYFCL
jgi:ribosomal protein L12E/L44/L45/RPP1/RPP2